MTWDTERKKSGRRFVRVVEIELDFCQLDYSISPCQAALGTTGEHKCYNTFKTCQDTPNYDPAPKVYRFIDSIEGVPRSVDAFPVLESVEMAPTFLDPGRSLGKRASVSATFRDFPHHDRDVDKYVRERLTGDAAADGSTFDPFNRGSFFTKLRARNPFYIGRKMHILTGYLPWDHDLPPDDQPAFTEQNLIDNLRRRTYVMERWEGPDQEGRFSIVAKDVLKLADNDRATIPVETNGRLLSGIDTVATSATLTPSGIGDDEYPASGTVRINDELMTFTRSGDDLTLTRATDNTEADDHAADDSVQNCHRWTNTRVDQIIKDMLEDFTNIDPAWIPFADWQAEADSWLSEHKFSTVISEPTGVIKLLNELHEQSMLYVWWHEIDQEIKFSAVRPFSPARALDQDGHILEGQLTRRDNPDQRLSRLLVYFDRINPTEDLDEAANFRQLRVDVDVDAESDNEYDQKRSRTIFSRWLSAGNRPQVVQLASRLLQRYRDDPVEHEFTLGAKDADLWVGDVFSIRNRLIVNERGEQFDQRIQAIEVEEQNDGKFRYRCVTDQFSGRFGIIGPDTLADYTSATDTEKQSYGFIAPDSGAFSDGELAYKII